MKVLYFHQHFSTPQGSTGTRSYEMARELIRNGHSVTMVCGSFNMGSTGLKGPGTQGIRRGNVDGIDVIEFLMPYKNADGFVKRSLTFLRFSLHCVRIALTEQFDVLFATSTPLTVGIPGIVMKWLKPRPFVFEVRDLWPELPREMKAITNPLVLWAMGVLEKRAYLAADRHIALSPGIAEGITRYTLSRKSAVATIPNGCDLQLFKPLGREQRVPIPGCSRDDFVALFTGAHGLANGLDAVLNAARELKRRGEPRIKLVLIGDGREKKRLVRRAADENLHNCVFLDPIPKTELARMTASADAGLQVLSNIPAFYRGTSPNKFFDYLAAGIPIINNYPGWLADLINEYRCGLTVAPDNPESFADALITLSRNPELCSGMGQAARRLAESKFDRTALAGEFVRVLEQTSRP